jgi:hypothetical protein
MKRHLGTSGCTGSETVGTPRNTPESAIARTAPRMPVNPHPPNRDPNQVQDVFQHFSPSSASLQSEDFDSNERKFASVRSTDTNHTSVSCW